MTKSVLLAAVLSAAVFTVGCDDKSSGVTSEAPQSGTSASATAGLPAGLRLPDAPAGAQDVAAAKSAVKDGDPVVIQGVIAGRADPIAENRAILTLLDSNIKTCDKNPGDGCKTPWDACCEPADVLSKNSVTVQVVDADGKPLKTSLSGIDGVKPLAKVVVTGQAKVSADGVVLVNAKGLHVAR